MSVFLPYGQLPEAPVVVEPPCVMAKAMLSHLWWLGSLVTKCSIHKSCRVVDIQGQTG